MRPGDDTTAGSETCPCDTDHARSCDEIVVGASEGDQRGMTTMEFALAGVVPSVSGMATPFFQTMAALRLDPAT